MKRTPPLPDNVGKRRKIVNIRGRARYWRIEDEICRRQSSDSNKVIYLQKLRREDDRTRELRLGYYMIDPFVAVFLVDLPTLASTWFLIVQCRVPAGPAQQLAPRVAASSLYLRATILSLLMGLLLLAGSLVLAPFVDAVGMLLFYAFALVITSRYRS